MKTPQSRFEDQLFISEQLGELDPAAYFRAGVGSDWLLCIAQGIERLQQHCLAIDGVLFIYSDASEKA